MKNNNLVPFYVSSVLAILLLTGTVFAQNANVGVNGYYEPFPFTNYNSKPVTGTPANGAFNLRITKSGALLPANNLSIVVSLSPDVPYTGAAFTVPEGFTLEVISNISLIFRQTGPYVGSGAPAFRDIVIPVQAIAPVAAAGPNNWVIAVQAEGEYTDNLPSNDTARGRVLVQDSPLPVKLVSFNVTKEGTMANLSWSTTAETNSERFDIQHSRNGKNWNEIGSVKSQGESAIKHDYSFTHKTPANGNNYYRLKMIDLDGTFAYSNIKNIDIQTDQVRIYPNPVADILTIETDLASLTKVQLYNLTGVVVYDSGAKVTDRINVRNLPGGMYMVRLSHGDGTFDVHKIIVAK